MWNRVYAAGHLDVYEATTKQWQTFLESFSRAGEVLQTHLTSLSVVKAAGLGFFGSLLFCKGFRGSSVSREEKLTDHFLAELGPASGDRSPPVSLPCYRKHSCQALFSVLH